MKQEEKNKMDGKDFAVGAIVTVLILGLIGALVFCFIDETYLYPQAAENANQFCQQQGYDFYEDFERIGLFSTTPVAIACKYVDNYQEIDMKL